MAPRKPMSFDMEPASVRVLSRPSSPTAPEVIRKTVATRLPPDLYRQAKARAALDDVSIQAVIEAALRDYIAKAVP